MKIVASKGPSRAQYAKAVGFNFLSRRKQTFLSGNERGNLVPRSPTASVKNRVRSGYEIMNEEKRLLQAIISLSNNFLGYERYIFGSL